MSGEIGPVRPADGPRIVGIVQARMGSSRLPGKVLRPLAGRSVLGRVVRAARDSGVLADLVVATSTDAVDDAVAAECDRLGEAIAGIERRASALLEDQAAAGFSPPPAGHKDWLTVELQGL